MSQYCGADVDLPFQSLAVQIGPTDDCLVYVHGARTVLENILSPSGRHFEHGKSMLLVCPGWVVFSFVVTEVLLGLKPADQAQSTVAVAAFPFRLTASSLELRHG